MFRDTWVEIDLDAIYHNVKVIKEYTGYENLYVVVKANAYGHGDVEVAASALNAGATHLAVAFLDEAIRLRRYFDVPILVMGYVDPEYYELASVNDIEIIVTEAIDFDMPLDVHLKIDTGMNRIGVKTKEEIETIINSIEKCKSVSLVGIMTHLATAGSNDSYYEMQINKLKELAPEGIFVHVNNSAGMLAYGGNFDAGRLGISMYGLKPYDGILPVELKQAFSLHSRITNVKKIKKGESVGYSATFTAEEDCFIAAIPIGYADGFIRKNKGRDVLINQIRYKLVGNICMDQCMILVDENVQAGDVVSLINDAITVDEVAKDLDTINYEIVCLISDRVPRIYKENNSVVKINNYRF